MYIYETYRVTVWSCVLQHGFQRRRKS